MPMTLTGAGGVVASVPTAPAGAVYALAIHPAYCRSDAACTVPCGVGDGIRWMKELVTGTWHEQATSGARPILRYDDTTGYYAEGDGVGRYFAFTHSTVADPKTVGIRMYAPSLTATSPSCGINSNNNILGRWDGLSGGLYDGVWVALFGSTYQAGVWQSTVASRSGGSTSAYLDGVVNDGTGGDLSHSWTLASFRLFQYSSFFSSDYFHRFVAYDSAVAHATVESWLAEANL